MEVCKNLIGSPGFKVPIKEETESLIMAQYLEPINLRMKLSDAQLLFQLGTKMVQLKANYSSKYREDLNCIICEKEGRFQKDTQKHIMKCPIIRK